MKSTILIVEDNPLDLEVVKKILSEAGYEVIYAVDGKGTFAILEEAAPDLIILDLMLPDTDGFEICKFLQKNDRWMNVPIIFLSSSDSLGNKLMGLKLGASDFLSKGCNEKELLLRVRNLLRVKKIYDETLRLTIIDSLTRVYNRRYFQYRLMDEFQRGKRYERQFCCMIMDIDNFKSINNSLGKPKGDQILKKVAVVLRANMRTADILCRYGGDEFGVLLPETDFHGAQVMAERLKNLVAQTNLDEIEKSLKITLSCGISSLVDNHPADREELLTQADVALHQAKKTGQNIIGLYGKAQG
ncbi:MAG: diguanylate cyclase [Candidatus Omnitrophota bacterium]